MIDILVGACWIAGFVALAGAALAAIVAAFEYASNAFEVFLFVLCYFIASGLAIECLDQVFDVVA